MPIQTISDASKLTVTQLREQLLPTKRDALIAINGSEKIADEPVRTYRKDGQIESQSEILRDVETGTVVSGKTVTWTYYEDEKNAPVDEIVIIETDARGDEVNRKIIKHYSDGRQPEVKEK